MASEAIQKSPDTALAQLNEKLSALIKRGESIKVSDQASDIEAKQFKILVKSYEKAVELYTDADIADATERLSSLRNAKKMLLLPANQILERVETQRKAWEEDERRKAEAEQRRLNEENRIKAAKEAEEKRKADVAEAEAKRKAEVAQINADLKRGKITKKRAAELRRQAGEKEASAVINAEIDEEEARNNVAPVKVLPSIPSVAGAPSRRNWRFKFVDASRVPDKYKMPNAAAIGEMVRNTKDKAKAEAECPGIEVWSE